MKRILALTLVLVMLIGVMPMASAEVSWGTGNPATCAHPNATVTEDTADCTAAGTKTYTCPDCHATGTEPSPKKEHNVASWSKPSGTFDCTTAYTESGTCSVCGPVTRSATPKSAHTVTEWEYAPNFDCTVGGARNGFCTFCGSSVTETVAAGTHSYPSAAGTLIEAATCQKAGSEKKTCTVCGKEGTVVIPIDANAHNYDPTTGKCTNKATEDGEACGAERPNNYVLSPVADFSLKAYDSNNNTKTLSYTLTNNGTAVTTGVTYTYASSDEDVATVSAGKVTAVAVGTTVITVTAKVGGTDVATDEITVTVTDGFKISCENIDVAEGGTKSLSPKASFSPSTGTISYTYTENSSYIAMSGSTVSGYSTGVTTVTIKGEYTIGSTVVADDTIEVYVSVYDDHTAYATLIDGVSIFDFADTGILAELKYDSKSYTKTELSNKSLGYYLAEGDWKSVSVVETTTAGAKDHIGTLAVGSYGNNSTTHFQFVTLTLNGTAGTAAYAYELYNAQGLRTAVGTLILTVSGTENKITYETSLNKAVTLDEKDFNDLWEAAKMTRGLDYVTFDVSSLVPYYGDLYTTASSTTRKDVTYNMGFAYQATNSDAYDLDTVTYVPSKYTTKAYTEEIPFTMYGLKSTEIVTGLLIIKVGGENPFVDVDEDDYFYDAVLWAVNEGVTTGVDETHFGPNKACTRGQVVTFLWRAAGEPDPSSSYTKFTDIKKSDYYYKAVLWAVEEGITTGMTETTFAPDTACTRAQVVTFLYRAAGEPTTTGINGFKDVTTSAYYYNPVRWAVKTGITNGIDSNTFGSSNTCTRGQIVTFLYRYYED